MALVMDNIHSSPGGLVSEIGSLATTGETSLQLIETLPLRGFSETSQLVLLREAFLKYLRKPFMERFFA